MGWKKQRWWWLETCRRRSPHTISSHQPHITHFISILPTSSSISLFLQHSTPDWKQAGPPQVAKQVSVHGVTYEVLCFFYATFLILGVNYTYLWWKFLLLLLLFFCCSSIFWCVLFKIISYNHSITARNIIHDRHGKKYNICENQWAIW